MRQKTNFGFEETFLSYLFRQDRRDGSSVRALGSILILRRLILPIPTSLRGMRRLFVNIVAFEVAGWL